MAGSTSTDQRIASPRFPDFYENEFRRLGHGLAYALGDTQFGIDAADGGLGVASRKWEDVRYDSDPFASVFQSSLAWADRRGNRDRLSTRLFSDGSDPDVEAVLAGLSRDERAALVTHHLYGWDQSKIATALGTDAANAGTLLERGSNRVDALSTSAVGDGRTRLRTYLATRLASTAFIGSGERAVSVRNRRATQRKRLAVVAGVAAVAAIALGVGFAATRGGDEVVAGDGADGVTARPVTVDEVDPNGEQPPGDVVLPTWSTAEGDSSLAFAQHFAAGSGSTVFAVASEGSVPTGPWGPEFSLWKSEGGNDWQQVETDEVTPTRVAWQNGVLYTVGTSSASIDDLVVARSTDEGDTWAETVISRSDDPIIEEFGSGGIGSMELLATPAGTMLTVQEWSGRWIGEIVPGAVNGDVIVTETGVDVVSYGFNDDFAMERCFENAESEEDFIRCEENFAPEPEVTESFTFEELDLTKEAADYLQFGRTTFWFSADGENFEQLDSPFDFTINQVQAMELRDGFLLMGMEAVYWGPNGATNEPRFEARFSTDGKEWEALDLPFETDGFGGGPQFLAAGALDGQPAVASINWSKANPTPQLHVADEAWNWTELDLSAILDPSTGPSPAIGIGPAGIVIAAGGEGGGFGDVAIAVEPGFGPVPIGPEGGGPMVLYASQDGKSWSETPMSDLIGDQPVAPWATRVTVGDDAIIVAVQLERFAPNGAYTSETRTIVGSFPE